MTLPTSDWLFWAVLSAVFAAATAVFAKVGLQGVDSDYALLLRTVVILAFLAVFVGMAGKWRRPDQLPWRAVAMLVVSGLATGLSWLCYFRALQLGEASKVAPVDKVSVVLVAVFAALFLGERLSPREWFAVALIGAGVVLLAVKR